MNNSLKKIWNVISSILVALVVLLALLLVGARVVGLQVFTVLSGSMEPTYHTGSLIYVKKVDPYTITDGQPITFMLDENTVATHRVVGIVPDEEDPTVIRFRTKGDANEAEDGVKCSKIVYRLCNHMVYSFDILKASQKKRKRWRWLGRKGLWK